MPRLFLHYLDRELLRSIGYPADQARASYITKILTLTTNSTLFANYSIVVEGNYLGDSEYNYIPLCVKFGNITLIAEEYSFDEFISTRQAMYAFDKHRYQMYYDSPKLLSNYLNSSIICDYDDIEKLTTHLNNWSMHNDFLLNKFLRRKDRIALEAAKPIIATILKCRETEAITSSFFEERIIHNKYGNAATKWTMPIARMLSILYVNDFLRFLDASIPTGISGVSYFDTLDNSFPFHDIPILHAILKKIGIEEVIWKNSDADNIRLIAMVNNSDYGAVTKAIEDIIGLAYYKYRSSDEEQHVDRDNIVKTIGRIVLGAPRVEPLNIASILARANTICNKLQSSIDATIHDVTDENADTRTRFNYFVSHASENKEGFVLSLIVALNKLGVSVWFDAERICVGHSIVDEINKGILSVTKGFIIILSEQYFASPWCIAELRTIVNLSVTRQLKIIPVRLNVTHEYIISNQPLLADILSIDSTLGVDMIAERILGHGL